MEIKNHWAEWKVFIIRKIEVGYLVMHFEYENGDRHTEFIEFYC